MRSFPVLLTPRRAGPTCLAHIAELSARCLDRIRTKISRATHSGNEAGVRGQPQWLNAESAAAGCSTAALSVRASHTARPRSVLRHCLLIQPLVKLRCRVRRFPGVMTDAFQAGESNRAAARFLNCFHHLYRALEGHRRVFGAVPDPYRQELQFFSILRFSSAANRHHGAEPIRMQTGLASL